MDIENLAKELILKNMTPEQQMAVLESVRQSVANAKEVQKKKIGENVDLLSKHSRRLKQIFVIDLMQLAIPLKSVLLLSKTVVMVLMVQMGVMVKMVSQAEMV
jgi:hypothetical protein